MRRITILLAASLSLAACATQQPNTKKDFPTAQPQMKFSLTLPKDKSDQAMACAAAKKSGSLIMHFDGAGQTDGLAVQCDGGMGTWILQAPAQQPKK